VDSSLDVVSNSSTVDSTSVVLTECSSAVSISKLNKGVVSPLVTEDSQSVITLFSTSLVQVSAITSDSIADIVFDLFEPYIPTNVFDIKKVNRVVTVQAVDRTYTVEEQNRFPVVNNVNREYQVEQQIREFAV